MSRYEKALTAALLKHGAVLKRNGKHRVFTLPNGYNFVTASSPSDVRATQNALSELRRRASLTKKETESLKAGQLIRYDNAVWRVDHVNPSRARIIPFRKRRVVIKDDDGNEVRSFDASEGGVNISPNSFVPIVTEEDAVGQCSFDHVYPTNAKGTKCFCGQKTWGDVPERHKAAVEFTQTTQPATPAPRLTKQPKAAGTGWKAIPTLQLKPGTLGGIVHAAITASPGITTPALLAALDGRVPQRKGEFATNLAACLSRLKQGGLIEKEESK